MSYNQERAGGGWDNDAWSSNGEFDSYDDDSVFDVEIVESVDPDGQWANDTMPESLADSSDWQEAYSLGVTYQDAVRALVGPVGETLTDEDVDGLLREVTSGLSPIEAENFWKALGSAAKSVGKVAAGLAPTVLPILGGAVGTFFGGPAGTAIGTALGSAAGGAIGQLAAKSPSLPQPPPRPAVQQPMPRVSGTSNPGMQPRGPVAGMPARYLRPIQHRPVSAVPAGGSSATAQLASLLQHPALIQSLLGALLGGGGTVKVGEPQVEVPFGAFMNALECLAAEAAEEVHDRNPQHAGIPAYLVESDGEPIESVTVAEVRASRLLGILNA